MPSIDSNIFEGTASRWRAVSSRDAAAHCSFLYGVKTTKVYCRPTCTARIARRANVVYFDTVEQAERDNFRPCIRCRPDDPTFLGQREEVVIRALGLLRNGCGSARLQSGVKTLAREVGVTPSYLCRVFKQTMGCTLSEYCRRFDERAWDESQSGMKRLGTIDISSEGEECCEQSAWRLELLTPEVDSSRKTSGGLAEPWLCSDSSLDQWAYSEGLEFAEWTVEDEMVP